MLAFHRNVKIASDGIIFLKEEVRHRKNATSATLNSNNISSGDFKNNINFSNDFSRSYAEYGI